MHARLKHNNVRARVPLRLGLGGGGSDLDSYSRVHGGVVLNSTIDKYAYAHLATNPDGMICFMADDLGQTDIMPATMDFDIREGLPLHRAVYAYMMETYNDGQPMPLSISTTIDVPAGSGLGASSALTVALIEAFVKAMQISMGNYEMAELAYHLERERLGMLGGKQDQYAAAFGGFNYIEFLAGGRVVVNPLRLHRDCLNEFESSLVICFSGQSRESARIIEHQVSGLKAMDERTLHSLHDIKKHAGEMKNLLLAGSIKATADILQQSWLAKKNTASSITNGAIDNLLEIALQNGAWGGKVSGAGGGGFIMLLADPARRHHLIEALNANGGSASSVRLTFEGPESWVVPS